MDAQSVRDSPDKVWGLVRIGLGLVFLWAFIDKLIGLGFATCRNADTNAVEVLCSRSWLSGGSPASGFLEFGTRGPLGDFYKGLAGNEFIDWLYMLGLLGVGLALVLGVAIRLAAVSGSLLVLMIYSAAWPPANNPLIDEHIIYVLVLVGLWRSGADRRFGLGQWWSNQPLVKRLPILR